MKVGDTGFAAIQEANIERGGKEESGKTIMTKDEFVLGLQQANPTMSEQDAEDIWDKAFGTKKTTATEAEYKEKGLEKISAESLPSSVSEQTPEEKKETNALFDEAIAKILVDAMISASSAEAKPEAKPET